MAANEAPSPVDDLGACFCLQDTTTWQLVVVHLGVHWIAPYPLPLDLHSLLAVADGVVKHALDVHLIAFGAVGV